MILGDMISVFLSFQSGFFLFDIHVVIMLRVKSLVASPPVALRSGPLTPHGYPGQNEQRRSHSSSFRYNAYSLKQLPLCTLILFEILN